MHAKAFAGLSYVPFPAEARAFLDRHSRFDRGRKDAIAIRFDPLLQTAASKAC